MHTYARQKLGRYKRHVSQIVASRGGVGQVGSLDRFDESMAERLVMRIVTQSTSDTLSFQDDPDEGLGVTHCAFIADEAQPSNDGMWHR